MIASIFFFAGTVLVPVIHSQINGFLFVNLNLTWKDAQQHCRDHFNDLATVGRKEHHQILIPDGAEAWIGLFDDPASWKGVMNSDANSWRWSATQNISSSRYMAWESDQPDSFAREECTIFISGSWNDVNCNSKYVPACYNVESGVKQFISVNLTKTWGNALNYCREHYHDLAMIENSAENQEVVEATQGLNAWIGLYRKAWRWSDNSTSSFRHWASGEPNNQHRCVAMGSDRLWRDEPCERRLPFVCSGPAKLRGQFKLRLLSTADLLDNNITGQIIQALNMKLGVNVTMLKMNRIKPPTES